MSIGSSDLISSAFVSRSNAEQILTDTRSATNLLGLDLDDTNAISDSFQGLILTDSPNHSEPTYLASSTFYVLASATPISDLTSTKRQSAGTRSSTSTLTSISYSPSSSTSGETSNATNKEPRINLLLLIVIALCLS